MNKNREIVEIKKVDETKQTLNQTKETNPKASPSSSKVSVNEELLNTTNSVVSNSSLRKDIDEYRRVMENEEERLRKLEIASSTDKNSVANEIEKKEEHTLTSGLNTTQNLSTANTDETNSTIKSSNKFTIK